MGHHICPGQQSLVWMGSPWLEWTSLFTEWRKHKPSLCWWWGPSWMAPFWPPLVSSVESTCWSQWTQDSASFTQGICRDLQLGHYPTKPQIWFPPGQIGEKGVLIAWIKEAHCWLMGYFSKWHLQESETAAQVFWLGTCSHLVLLENAKLNVTVLFMGIEIGVEEEDTAVFMAFSGQNWSSWELWPWACGKGPTSRNSFPFALPTKCWFRSCMGVTLLSGETGAPYSWPISALRCSEDQPLRFPEEGLAPALGFQSCTQHLLGPHPWDIPLKFLRIRQFFSETKMKDDPICLSSLDVNMYVKALGYIWNIV